jgi:hypothetical protein
MRRIKLGSTDRTVTVFIPDPASTDGSGKTGLTHADLTVSYARVETDNDVTVTDATGSLSTLTALTDAHADWGVKEISSALAPGLYRLDLADAVFASGAWEAVVYVEITSSAAAASPIGFELIAYDPLDTVRLGLTALPNAAADAAGGLIISDAGGLDADDLKADVTAILADTGTDGVVVASVNNNAITAAAIAAGAIDAATFAADVDAEILSYIVDDATRIDASALNTASVTTIPAILADTGTDGVVVNAAGLATDAVTEIVTAVLTTQMTEAYATDGAAPTLAQSLCLIQQMLGDFSISGTTLTVKKVDGSTSAATFTLNDGTSPTAITRAT